MQSDAQDVLDDRYGVRKKKAPRRWTKALIVFAVLAVGLVIAVVAYRNLGADPISAEQKSFTRLGDTGVRIVFTVTRDEQDKPVDCIVRSRDSSGSETGRREVFIPAGEASTTVTTQLQTIDAPVTGEVYGCSYDIPAYLQPSG